jgi:5-methylcytosine-specific restriction endonuclease McrA
VKREETQLRAIYDRTEGQCHNCRKRLTFRNYGLFGKRGAWEIEHSVAQARGGTDHGNNLFAACISCNRSKGDSSSRESLNKSPDYLSEVQRLGAAQTRTGDENED